ncbi:MAG: hypothetical protein E6L03_10455 [Thaumarchaeota archaeon]|nr:MAG: hypothetical protein E6L03_10455 [Nitrososphaerota archaeon]
MTRNPEKAKRYHKCYRCGVMMGCAHISGSHNCSIRYGGCGYKGPRFEVGIVTEETRTLLAKFVGKTKKGKTELGTRELAHAIKTLMELNKSLILAEAISIVRNGKGNANHKDEERWRSGDTGRSGTNSRRPKEILRAEVSG